MEYADTSYSSAAGQEPSAAKAEDLDTNKPKSGPRKRVSQACDRCRSRKDKCDGKKPSCSTCTTHGRECSYDTNVKKRGLPEGYVRGMEKLWGLAIREVTDVENNILLVINDENRSDDFLADWKDEGNSDNLVETWRKSKISKELENLLSNTEQTADSRKRKHADSNSRAENRAWLSTTQTNSQTLRDQGRNVWVDEKSNVFTQGNSRDPSGLHEAHDNGNLSLGGETTAISPSYQQTSPGKRRAVSAANIELPSEAWHLINVYSSYTHPWLPIVERQDLLRSTYQYLRKPSDFSITGTGSGNHAVLWAVIAYEKLQHRAINRIPQAQGPVAEVVWTAERMYDQARDLIPDEDGVFELGHVQALLILALANIGNGRLSRAWLLVGQATRIAIDMGLGRPSDDILVSLKSPSRAKHVFLACFILDTIIATRLGYRPHLRAEDVELVGSVEEEGLDEWDPWQDCLQVSQTTPPSRPASVLSTFNQFVKHIQILNEAICEPRSHGRERTVKELLYKLHALGQDQPSPLSFDTTPGSGEQSTSLLPHHYNLHIARYSILATLQLMSYTLDKEGPDMEFGAESARLIVELLIQHSARFGLLIVPPTFELYVKSAYNVVREVQSHVGESNINLASWKHSLEIYTDIMEPVWPVFESLRGSVSDQIPSAGRRESQVAFDLISGPNRVSNTPPTSSTPSSLTSSHAPQHLASGYQLDITANAPAQQVTQMVPPALSHTRQLGLSTRERVADSYPIAQSSFDLNNPIDADSKHRLTHGSRISHSSNPESSSPTHVRQRLSIPNDMELDPMFQEFATLDATEWAGNWDQGLVNLGFTDPDRMNQDFYTMSREPDPQFPSTVFQQLMANSNPEETVFPGGSTSGISGREQTTFNDEHEGIEASHILQSLSAAGDMPMG